MRVENREIIWYSIDELKEHDEVAYTKALEMLDLALWQDGMHNETLAQDMIWAFGQAVGEPTFERYGPGDYPGVPAVELTSWSIGNSGQHVGFAGTLDRDNAPGLPWHEWIDSVELTADRYATGVQVRPADTEDVPWMPRPGRAATLTEDEKRLQVVCEELAEAVRVALDAALNAGVASAEALSSEQYLHEHAQANELEFTAGGQWA